MPWILVLGNIVEGLTFVGPFSNEREVTEYASGGPADDYFFVELEEPDSGD